MKRNRQISFAKVEAASRTSNVRPPRYTCRAAEGDRSNVSSHQTYWAPPNQPGSADMFFPENRKPRADRQISPSPLRKQHLSTGGWGLRTARRTKRPQ
eukprot:7333681-Prymnesium_polylepis.1